MNIRDRLYISTFSNDAISLAKDYHIGLEINHTCISENLDDKDRLIDEIKDDVDGINNLIVHGPFTEIYPSAIDHRIREQGLLRLKEGIYVCERLKVKNMVVHSGYVPFIYFKEYHASSCGTFFNELLKDNDINIYIENVLEDEPYMLKNMMEEIGSPRCKLCLDIGHLNAMSHDLDVFKWIEILKEYIGHFHLHNNFKDKDSHNNFYEGTMDVAKVIKYVYDLGIDSTFTIEAHDAFNSLKYLKEKDLI